MKIGEAIENARELMAGAVSDETLLRWLSALDGQVKLEIIDTHAGGGEVLFTPYGEDTDTDTELLIPQPYDEVYRYFLEAQMLFANGELEEYNAVAARYEESYAAYAAWYNRTHMSKQRGGWRW